MAIPENTVQRIRSVGELLVNLTFERESIERVPVERCRHPTNSGH
ncbi:hypothetical protein [Fibrella forsythiae]|nr:hypothetical protein [Fibrella forsythiae]